MLPPQTTKETMMSQDEMTDEYAELLAFFKRGSSYDVLQSRQGGGWGTAWTVAPCDVHASERAAWMLRRMGARDVRHARRARLRTEACGVQGVMVVTDLPERLQAVLRLADGSVLNGLPYLSDAALAALEVAFTPPSETAV